MHVSDTKNIDTIRVLFVLCHKIKKIPKVISSTNRIVQIYQQINLIIIRSLWQQLELLKDYILNRNEPISKKIIFLFDWSIN